MHYRHFVDDYDYVGGDGNDNNGDDNGDFENNGKEIFFISVDKLTIIQMINNTTIDGFVYIIQSNFSLC